MSNEKILVVEDEEDILELVTYTLEREGYRVKGVATGEEGLETAQEWCPDVMVLDLMLPGLDGFELAKRLKRDPDTEEIAILMLTAKDQESDIVAGLELGADDYIPKPFSPRVLLARIRAVLRRLSQEPAGEDAVIEKHGLAIHPGRHEVTAGDEPVELTSTEFRILHLLARRPGWVYTRYQIVDEVRGEDYPVTDRSVDVHISGLRKKLGEYGKYIETVRGVGYRFKD